MGDATRRYTTLHDATRRYATLHDVTRLTCDTIPVKVARD
jgi:hypothetical protein